ncbi:hypothetical protein N7468_008263 [Penicillium chermesinum]|uniref:Thiol-specific monooxygenase n=1 Tax=Penicillium chermesinum TaxID=63820 RepID=A0A9W9NPR0_9EURO|nr:uncharacterized protein N7468_008263 [Penicillium chermesinum]KAJ5223721.1 hypothetical protein N7468_008263 [Penicillium chermesinum]
MATLGVRRVAIIGAGPCGLAAAKYLMAEKYFEQIDVFEQRNTIGGIWNYTPCFIKAEESSTTTVPNVDAQEPAERPTWTTSPHGNTEPIFVSPIYAHLETNNPKELLRFSEKALPADAQLFPKHAVIRQYLESYGEEVKDLVQFETQVQNLKVKDPQNNTWELTATNLRTGAVITSTYDAVVAANGHYVVPYIPDILGVSAWNKAYPNSISHSKFYDSPEVFRGKKVVIIGGAASGLDIGAQIGAVTKGKIIVSQRSESYLAVSAPSDRTIRPQIAEFLPPASHDREIRFSDGHVEDQVDAVLFCTGYFYSFPFLQTLEPPVVTDGSRTRNVYKQIFYIEHPTLAFPVLAQKVTPFPMAENQAAVFARVWSGRLPLPSKEDMKASEDAEIALRGDGKAFHVYEYPVDCDYMNEMYSWAGKAQPRSGLDNDGHGKPSAFWGEKERWLRSKFPDIRRAFVNQGEKRSEIKSIVDLGFEFGAWKRRQQGAPKL